MASWQLYVLISLCGLLMLRQSCPANMITGEVGVSIGNVANTRSCKHSAKAREQTGRVCMSLDLLHS